MNTLVILGALIPMHKVVVTVVVTQAIHIMVQILDVC
jgi:hypothetical protein